VLLKRFSREAEMWTSVSPWYTALTAAEVAARRSQLAALAAAEGVAEEDAGAELAALPWAGRGGAPLAPEQAAAVARLAKVGRCRLALSNPR